MHNFYDLYRKVLQIKLFGIGGDPQPNNQDLFTFIEEGELHLPLNYVEGYVKPLKSNLSRLIQLVETQRLPLVVLETLSSAVYQHRLGNSLNVPLRRFLAVLSNTYRSFLADEKRREAGAPLRNTLAPLAVFQREGNLGPFTVTVDEVAQLTGGIIALVSLPATYANHPLLWGIIAHEAAGHGVIHEEPKLLQQLASGISTALSGIESFSGVSLEEMTLLWSYWLAEATADIYGVMNLGPAFSPSMAVLFSAGLSQGVPIAPRLRMKSRFSSSDPSMILDPHPTDILRLHLVIGAIESLSKLSSETKLVYCNLINDLSAILAEGTEVVIDGKIPVGRDRLQQINITLPLSVLQTIAQKIGAFIATTKLDALGGISIQNIETWDDYDEERSQLVRDALVAGRQIMSLGDDAHFLAGATMAALEEPSKYEAITTSLNEALDLSFIKDPIWGIPQPHSMFWTKRKWTD